MPDPLVIGRGDNRRDRHLGRAVNIAGTIAAVLGLIAAAVGLIAIHISVVHTAVIVAAAGAPVLLACGAVGAVVALLIHRRLVALACAAVVAAGAVTYAPLFRADPPPTDVTAASTVRLLQTNLGVGHADPVALTDLVRDSRIDIVTAEELTEDAAIALRDAGLEEALPYRMLDPRAGAAGTGIYSRYPLSGERIVDATTLSNLRAEVAIGSGRPMVVYAVHPVAAYVAPAELWAADLSTLRAELASPDNADGPIVVSGDFNATRSHRQFRDLLDLGYHDATDITGAGYLPTYPTDHGFPALLDIDHVLVQGATIASLERVSLPGTDHHALIADIVLPPTH